MKSSRSRVLELEIFESHRLMVVRRQSEHCPQRVQGPVGPHRPAAAMAMAHGLPGGSGSQETRRRTGRKQEKHAPSLTAMTPGYWGI